MFRLELVPSHCTIFQWNIQPFQQKQLLTSNFFFGQTSHLENLWFADTAIIPIVVFISMRTKSFSKSSECCRPKRNTSRAKRYQTKKKRKHIQDTNAAQIHIFYDHILQSGPVSTTILKWSQWALQLFFFAKNCDLVDFYPIRKTQQ